MVLATRSGKKESRLAKFIDAHIDMLRGDKTQIEIAEALGYDRPQIITMFKQGRTRVPLNKIGPLARALGADPARMMRLALEEYSKETWEAIADTIGEPVTQNERSILKALREMTNGADYEITEPDEHEALKKLADTLVANKAKIKKVVRH